MSFNFALYTPATRCSGGPTDGALALAAYLEDRFPYQLNLGIYNCRKIAGTATRSHHSEGRAYDCGIPLLSNGKCDVPRGMAVVNLLGPHGARLGIEQLIFNRKTWRKGIEQGAYYTGVSPHYDHVHIAMSRTAGARLNYSTLVSVLGPPKGSPAPVPPVEVGEDEMLPLKQGQRSEDVRMLKDRLNEAYNPNPKLDIASSDVGDYYDPETVKVVKQYLGTATGHPDGKEGKWVVANQWNKLEIDWIKSQT